jgi:adenylosuccinate lyase
VGRETAHAVIRDHALAAARELRAGASGNALFDRLAADERLGLSREDMAALVSDPGTFTGAASAQVRAVVDRVAVIVALHPDAETYEPAPLV